MASVTVEAYIFQHASPSDLGTLALQVTTAKHWMPDVVTLLRIRACSVPACYWVTKRLRELAVADATNVEHEEDE